MMRVNIYYGGRGLIEDPTIYVMNKMSEVLNELRVEVIRYNLYEEKNNIATLPKTLKDADAVILAAQLEWLGIGGYMQQFLDACWLYADKDHIKQLYMLPVVMSSTFGERDAEAFLIKAWEILGGMPVEGIRAYVSDHIEFETNPEYALLIEKAAENLYRNISQKMKRFPTSTGVVKESVMQAPAFHLTPQESEQLSEYVSNDRYVKRQKEDIQELTQIFKEMLGDSGKSASGEFMKEIKKHFHPVDGFSAVYMLVVSDAEKNIVVEVNADQMSCYYGEHKAANVTVTVTKKLLEEITSGEKTLQRAFMGGELTAKGDFKTLRSFDTVFRFGE